MTKSNKRRLSNANQSTTKKEACNSSNIEKTVVHPSNSIFTLFSHEPHQVNWYVYRSKHLRDQLKKLWGKGPANKKDLSTYNEQQLIVARTNALMRHLETYGPAAITKQKEFTIKLDSKHGSSSNPKKNCFSKGYYHAHVLDGNLTFVLAWECFDQQKVINILKLGAHENLDYSFKGHKPYQGLKSAQDAAKKAGFKSSESRSNRPSMQA